MTHHGTECQPDWKIKRADGENDTLGFLSDDRAEGCKVDVEGCPFCTSPLVDTVIGDFAVADGRVEFEAAAVKQQGPVSEAVLGGTAYTETHKAVSRGGRPRSSASAFLKRS